VIHAPTAPTLRDHADLLARLRSGEPGAKKAMLDAYGGMIQRVAGDRKNLWGVLYLALDTAVDRLAKNDEEDVDGYLRNELRRALHAHRRKEGRHIYPPPSTNSGRRGTGKEPHQTLWRLPQPTEAGRRPADEGDDDEPADWFESPLVRLPVATQQDSGKPYRVPSRLRKLVRIELDDEIDALAPTPLERLLLELLRVGCSLSWSADLLDLPYHRVKAMKADLRARATRQGRN
jgi:hypothetical protein